MNVQQIDPRAVEMIEKMNLYCLRDVRSNKLLDVSYTPDGFKYTTNDFGRLIYFTKARLQLVMVKDKKYLLPKGNLSISPNVIVEKFVPINHRHPKLQIAEYFGVNKAFKLHAVARS